jgi:hypothetical protein
VSRSRTVCVGDRHGRVHLDRLDDQELRKFVDELDAGGRPAFST